MTFEPFLTQPAQMNERSFYSVDEVLCLSGWTDHHFVVFSANFTQF